MARNTRNRVAGAAEVAEERALAWLWQHQRLKPGLQVEGESLEVIFPGRRNGLGGPDFRRAILATPQGQRRGDVEVHLRSSQWQAHGHQRDHAYNGVVLHVVLWPDSTAPIYLQNGRRVPTLALYPYLLGQEEGPATPPREPCREGSRRMDEAGLGQLLDSLGEERFRAKSALLKEGMARAGAAQALYQGIAEALGYSHNQGAFRELAQRLPLLRVESAARRQGLKGVLALLLGKDGLLSPEIPWQRQGVRPANRPERRLEALSHLLVRYAAAGWLSGLLAAVGQACQQGSQRSLEAAIEVPGLLGRSRAGEILVNVLLPLAHAYGLEGQAPSAGSGQALQLYRGYPPLGENEITQEMAELLGVDKRQVNSACRQQGLIHLFKNFCGERRCTACPMGGPK